MELRDWLSIVFIVGIALVLLDGYRRKWLERKRSLKVKLDKSIPPADDYQDDDVEANHEFPNGGARPSVSSAPYYGSSRKEESFETDDLDELGDEDIPVLMDTVELEEFGEFEETENRGADTHQEIDALDSFEVETIALEAVDDDELDESHDNEFEAFSEEPEESDGESEEELSAYTAEHNELEQEPELEQVIQEEIVEEERLEAERLEEESAISDIIQSENSDRLEPVFTENFGSLDDLDDLDEFEDEPMVAENRNKAEEKPATYTKADQSELFFDQHEEAETEQQGVSQEPQEVIVINVMSKAEESFSGQALLPILTKQGMRLGDMSIFHRHRDVNGNGPVMFSMANMVKPGTFDITKMEEFTTPGISFFLQMPNAAGNMKSFEQMLSVAESIKLTLGGDLKDEDRNIITRQTLEHSRERIRDFELKQLSNK